MKRLISILLPVWLCAALLCGCGRGGGGDTDSAPTPDPTAAGGTETAQGAMTFRQAAPTPTPAKADTPAPDALQAYTVNGVGTFWLPAGFEMAVEESSDPIPARSVTFTKNSVTVRAVRYAAGDFQAAGWTMPADLDSFAAWDGVRQAVPQDAAFDTDDFGNLFADWIDSDGLTVYYVLKAGTDSFGVAAGYAPEGEQAVEEIPLWLSKAVIN